VLSKTLLVASAAVACQANHLVFSVHNLATVPWILVDETKAGPTHGYRLGLQAGSSAGETEAVDGPAQFTVAPGATLTFEAGTAVRSIDRLSLRLQPVPGHSQPPQPGAGLALPIMYASREEACHPGGAAFDMHTFVIRKDGLIAVRFMNSLIDQEPTDLAAAPPRTEGSPADLRVHSKRRLDDHLTPPGEDQGEGLAVRKRVRSGEDGTLERARPVVEAPGPDALRKGWTAPEESKANPASSFSSSSSSYACLSALELSDPDGHAITVQGEAVRQDVAASAMFLGHEEGQILAAHLDLTVDVHIPLQGRRDSANRIRIDARSRFGGGEPGPPREDGLILLLRGRHYTILRPASPAEEAPFVLMDGTPCIELTRTVAGGEAPLIPNDGHCLITALHFLKHGTVTAPVRAYRRHVADQLSCRALNAMAGELAEEVIAGPHGIEPDGCFSTLGPALSLCLNWDRDFIARYAAAILKQRLLLEIAIMEAELQRLARRTEELRRVKQAEEELGVAMERAVLAALLQALPGRPPV
jgi:hypothetical protein